MEIMFANWISLFVILFTTCMSPPYLELTKLIFISSGRVQNRRHGSRQILPGPQDRRGGLLSAPPVGVGVFPRGQEIQRT
jgi:hypothetical protein